jgi:hypothetical protein
VDQTTYLQITIAYSVLIMNMHCVMEEKVKIVEKV